MKVNLENSHDSIYELQSAQYWKLPMTIKNSLTVESRKYNPDFQIRFFLLQVNMPSKTSVHWGVVLMMGQVNLPMQGTKLVMNSKVLSNNN